MSIYVQSQHYASEAEQYAAAKARKARLYGPMKRVNRSRVVEAPPEPEPKPVAEITRRVLVFSSVPLWRQMDITFSTHVDDFYLYKATNGHKLKSYIRVRAEQFGMTYFEIISKGRTRKFTFPRQLIMWEIKTIIKPTVSYPEIGRLFGGRYHTTVRHCVRKIQGMKERGAIE